MTIKLACSVRTRLRRRRHANARQMAGRHRISQSRYRAAVALSARAHDTPCPDATPAQSCGMNLYLRKVIHPQAHDDYRVILKLEEGEFEIRSIDGQHGGVWAWGIDFETEGGGCDRKGLHEAVQGRERFAADEAT